MTIPPSFQLKTAAEWLRRAGRLRRGQGTPCLCYAILRRIALLPGLRCWTALSAGNLFHLSLQDTNAANQPARHLTTRLTQWSDLDVLAAYYGNRQRVENRLKRGDRCLVAESARGIGAAVWVSIGPHWYDEDGEELGVRFQFPAGVAWSYDGKGTKLGAWGTLMRHVPNFLRDQGVSELLTLIGRDNWRSIDAHRSLGYEKLGSLVCARLFRFSATFCRPIHDRWRLLPVQCQKLTMTRWTAQH